MSGIGDLLRSGRIQLSDRRKQPRFRFRGPVEVIAVDVVGAIVPTDIEGWTTDISSEGAVITVRKKLTCKGLFLRFANSDDVVMPASISRTIAEERAFSTYAVKFASMLDDAQLIAVLTQACESNAADEEAVAAAD